MVIWVSEISKERSVLSQAMGNLRCSRVNSIVETVFDASLPSP